MRHLIATVLGLSLLASGAAMAAPGNERGPGPADRASMSGDRSAPVKHMPRAVDRSPHGLGRPVTGRPEAGMGPARARHMAPPPRGMQHGPIYRTGYRMPAYAPGVVVRDWRGQGLRQAPRGHEWRRIDGRYLMVAIATGVITDIIVNGR